MADGHGGKRTPRNPAPASGPGKLSKRTDGGPGQKLQAQTDQEYGARKESLDQQRSAPMSQQDSIETASVPAGSAAPSYSAAPFGGESSRPGEPITHGVDIGPGGGTDALMQVVSGQLGPGPMGQMLAALATQDRSGVLSSLYQSALDRGA